MDLAVLKCISICYMLNAWSAVCQAGECMEATSCSLFWNFKLIFCVLFASGLIFMTTSIWNGISHDDQLWDVNWK